ncbi:DUF2778 domain-containing protein [Methylobacterium nodulans]|uniref:DUF2778 domain-containing protein n=1 Tax=Methylobacterium nodulans TaxID=114616 RepID=UPI0003147156|nr:DUF2778 domain-containing protein [Methylobacterium nodulans]
MAGLQMVLDPPSASAAAATRPARRAGPLAASLIALLSLTVSGDWHPAEAPPAPTGSRGQAEAPPAPVEEAPPAVTRADAAPAPPVQGLSVETPVPWQSALLDSVLEAALAPPSDPVEAPASETPDEARTAAPDDLSQDPARLAQPVPLPVPRPPELRRPRTAEPARGASRSAAQRAGVASPLPPVEDNRSFIEKLFDLPPASSPGLAYAALESNPVVPAPNRRLSPVPGPDVARATAVYDISARTVTLPNGERLEAHSGLGPHMDDPRFVHVRMRGATPPGTYDLTEREKLFHGVRAIRLTPVGGSGAVHGRVGLLAHTYMLGPSGASNGCVSFKDYNRFLQAFLRGEVQRLVVVAGRGQDGPPGTNDRRIGLSDRPAAGGNGA